MSNLLQHAKVELRAAGFFGDNDDIGPQVTALMDTFVSYGGHSGQDVTLETFERLARGKPLTPLTGEDDEWYIPAEISITQIQLNRRCNRIAKDEDMAWDTRHGRKPITFPYMPD